VHHIDMQKGNFATITLLYDKLFARSTDSHGGADANEAPDHGHEE